MMSYKDAADKIAALARDYVEAHYRDIVGEFSVDTERRRSAEMPSDCMGQFNPSGLGSNRPAQSWRQSKARSDKEKNDG